MAVALAMTGCIKDITPAPEKVEQESIFTADELRFLAGVGQDTKLNDNEIDRIIGEAIGFLDTEPSTRAVTSRKVANISPLSFPAASIPRLTRSGETETGEAEIEIPEDLFYVVNFEDDAGYSVIAADSRIEDEIAVFVGHGSLDPETNDNPGLQIVLDRLPAYAAASIARHEAWRDSVEVAMLDRLVETYPELAESVEYWLAIEDSSGTRAVPPGGVLYGPPVLIHTNTTYGNWAKSQNESVSPMSPVEWGQGSPFNESIEATYPPDYIARLHANFSGNGSIEIPAGCIAIALVHLMSYWEHPTQYHGLVSQYDSAGTLLDYIDWETINEFSGRNYDRPDRYKNWFGYMKNNIFANALGVRKLTADIIYQIGLDVNMEYDRDMDPDFSVRGSGTTNSEAIAFMRQIGFMVPAEQNYAKTPVISSLKARPKGRPVYMSGY